MKGSYPLLVPVLRLRSTALPISRTSINNQYNPASNPVHVPSRYNTVISELPLAHCIAICHLQESTKTVFRCFSLPFAEVLLLLSPGHFRKLENTSPTFSPCGLSFKSNARMYNNNGYGQGYGRGRGGLGGINPIGYVVKGIASGIGLASESIHAHKEKKAAKKAAEEEGSHHSPAPEQTDHLGRPEGSRQPSAHSATDHAEQPDYGALPAYEADEKHPVRPENQRSHSTEKGADGKERELEEGDEEQWDLDDAQDELIEREAVNPKKRPFERDPKKIVQHFIDDYPLPQDYHPHGRLSLPVVLPQRRPKDRSRGFIRAYAPELMNNDIDQAMFLDFLETFNLATQASPWLNAINMASFALIPLHLAFLPSQAASLAIALTVSVMKNMQSRKRYASDIPVFKGNLTFIADYTPSSTK